MTESLAGTKKTANLAGAVAVGIQIQDSYLRAGGIRARLREKQPIKPKDPFLARDVATVLIDGGLRPEECFRRRWEYVRDGALNIPFGKRKMPAGRFR